MIENEFQENDIGSQWHRWDLHLHTPSSYDYDNKSITSKDIVDRLLEEGIRVVAVTDHHTINISQIREIQQLGAGQLTVLPGIELRDDHGGNPVHYISIFPEDCDLEHVWTTFQGVLGLTSAGIREKGGDDRVYVPIEKGAALTRKLNGVVSIHAGSKSNSIEEIKNSQQFQQRIKYDITNEWVDLMEIGQLKDIDVHLKMIFPEIGFDRPLIICSDNHNAFEYGIKVPLWFCAEPTFRGLLMVLREPCDRIYIGQRPLEMIRVEQNQTKYIRGILFQRKATAPENEKWFNGSLQFNPGLVAIIGNKGTGKSALSDILGLLGGFKNDESFSFLNSNRFRHPTSGYSSHFEATLEWFSGEKKTRCLSDSAKPEEVERIKYLPQDHVEKVCNELVGLGEKGFERELKTVIFSHVPETRRLSCATLDDLIEFRVTEKQKRIEALKNQLHEISRLRSQMETQADPMFKKELQEQVIRLRQELSAHDKIKPQEVFDPSINGTTSSVAPVFFKAIENAETKKKLLNECIIKEVEGLRIEERRQAVAKRLIEKLSNFQKDYDVFKASLISDAHELEVSVDTLISLIISKESIERIRDQSETNIRLTERQLNDVEPPGLKKQLALAEETIVELQWKLDAPNRNYQLYLKHLADWKTRRLEILGSEEDVESLMGKEGALASLDKLPERIAKLKEKQIEIAKKIYQEKLALTHEYRILYGPVQQFIDSHYIAKDKLKLEFRAELICEDFSSNLLNLLALNRRGSFMGVDEGRERAQKLVESTKWNEAQSVQSFLKDVDYALHVDLREKDIYSVQLKDQLIKGKKQEDIFNLLYDLDYIQPRYVLRWEGKDLSMLSPGERGALLLVFYLLIDKGDIPLIMDQPEGNLDNYTVAKVLVDCIKEARKRRQVFIVTHNPNLAVVCDANQIIHANMKKDSGNEITYTSGALESPAMIEYVTDVLEGTRWAFRLRDKKYQVGEG